MGALLALWAAAHIVYAAAAWLVARPDDARPRARARIWIVIGVAVAARAVFIPAQPTLSEDVYRYLWDGRLVARGVNPYLHAPADSALAPFHDQLLRQLNHFDVPTIYPPAAQLLFGAVARVEVSTLAFKLATIPLEAALWIAIVFLLRRRGLPSERLLLFAWNPLVLIETYASGHLDLWMAAFLLMALAMLEAGRALSAGAMFAMAVMTKYTPLLLLPFMIRRRLWSCVAVAGAVSLLLLVPFWSAGPSLWTGLKTYLEHWEFNGSLYKLLRALGAGDAAARRALAVALTGAVIVVSLRARNAAGAALALWTAYLIASPTVFPWYLVPVAALLPLYPSAPMIAFSGLVALSYLPLPAYHQTGRWTLPSWIPWVEYGGWAATAMAAWWIARRAGAQSRRAAWNKDTAPT
jgi:hypothetical protein